MIEKVEDLGLDNILDEILETDIEGPPRPLTKEIFSREYLAAIDKCLNEKLDVSLAQCRDLLSAYTVENSMRLTQEFVNIAPHGDFGMLLEDMDSMSDFLAKDGHKAEYWKFKDIKLTDGYKNLLTIHFQNSAVDNGDVFDGFVYVSFSGKIRHAFTQGNDN